MAEETTSVFDEAKLASGFRIGLPVVTVVGALATGAAMGLPAAILVLAAGTFLGTIAFFWASLRVLSGDVPLPAELEALDASAHEIDSLSARKKMLLRALKDLDNELAIGKLEQEDHDAVAETYRRELKDVMKQVDASLAGHREKAEKLVKAHLESVGLGDSPVERSSVETPSNDDASTTPARVVCAKCSASNEVDAKFCKGCGAGLEEVAS